MCSFLNQSCPRKRDALISLEQITWTGSGSDFLSTWSQNYCEKNREYILEEVPQRWWLQVLVEHCLSSEQFNLDNGILVYFVFLKEYKPSEPPGKTIRFLIPHYYNLIFIDWLNLIIFPIHPLTFYLLPPSLFQNNSTDNTKLRSNMVHWFFRAGIVKPLRDHKQII